MKTILKVSIIIGCIIFISFIAFCLLHGKLKMQTYNYYITEKQYFNNTIIKNNTIIHTINNTILKEKNYVPTADCYTIKGNGTKEGEYELYCIKTPY